MEQEDREQLLEVRKRAITNGKLADNMKAFIAKQFLMYAESGIPCPPKLMESFLNMAMRLEDRHAAMFALSKREQALLEAQYARVDLEYLRLEAAQPAPATEQGGSNFIEALNETAADIWSEAETPDGKEGNNEHVDIGDSETGD
jgi:hypothetical protein